VLADLKPATVLPNALQWHVPIHSIRAGALAGRVQPRLIVSPRYVFGARTELVPVSRGKTLVELGEATFHFHQHAERNFGVLADLARRCDSYRLTVGDLDEAVALVTDLVHSTAAQEAS